MRRTSDMPRRRRITGRAVLITLGVLILVVVVFGRAVARAYVDYLWYSSLGRGDVFWGQITAKLTLFGVFALVFVIAAGVQPVHRRPPRAENLPGQRASVRRALPRVVRTTDARTALRGRRAVRPPPRPADDVAVGELPAVPQQEELRRGRPAVRRRRGLLPVRVAVPLVRPRLAVHRRARDTRAHGSHARAQRRRGLRLTGAVDPQRQQGPHRRVAGGARRAQGR